MTMIKFYYYGMPILMFAQTVLMLYMTAAIKGINRKMNRRGGKHEQIDH